MDDDLSVARPKSPIFNRNEELLEVDWSSVLTMCFVNGQSDKRRISRAARSLDFGVKVEFTTKNQFYGMQHFNSFRGNFDEECSKRAKKSLANVIDFIWMTGNEIQQTLGKPTLGGIRGRRSKFGYPFCEMFGCRKSPEFEAVTVSHMILTGKDDENNCLPHVDKLNDTVYAYSKTLSMNVMLFDSMNLHLLQVICNFRKVGDNHILGKSDTRIIINNIEQYLQKLSMNYASFFSNADDQYTGLKINRDRSFTSDPTDLSDFFLSDDMKFENIKICEGYEDTLDVIRPMIGTSRELSMSGFLSAIVPFADQLLYDELMEICFFVSFVGTPVCFHWVMKNHHDELTRADRGHPLTDIIDFSVRKFGSFHKGISQRYSVSSNALKEQFSSETPVATDQKIKSVMKELLNWILYIESKQHSNYISPREIVVQARTLIKKLKVSGDCQGLDFDCFRLGVFTTIVCALGMVKPGVHLMQFILPFEKTASLRHLINPTEYETSDNTYSQCVKDDEWTQIDGMMSMLSAELKFPQYSRNLMEVILCESFGSRYLHKRDVFIPVDWFVSSTKPVSPIFTSIDPSGDLNDEPKHIFS